MATYYIRTDGNDSNTGLGATTATAWRTIAKALGVAGITSGDTVYIAPGVYTESITVGMTSATTTTSLIGDPTCTFFSGVNPGVIKLTTLDGSGTNLYTSLITATSKNFLSFQNIYFEYGGSATALTFTTCTNTSFNKCIFAHCGTRSGSTVMLRATAPASTNANLQISQCAFFGGYQQILITNIVGVNDSSEVKTTLLVGPTSNAFGIIGKVNVTNCTIAFTGTGASGLFYNTGSATFPSIVKNNIFAHTDNGIYITTANSATESYNRFVGVILARTNISAGTGSTTIGNFGFDLFESLLYGLLNVQPFGSTANSVNTGFGNATGAPASDLFGINWTGVTPDAGSITYRTVGGISPYLPTERNASAITIAPGSTSQSIELYLGATGLTFATSGLAAYYVRNREAPVAITLVTQTPTGAWASGGFAEISSSLVPGVYRLDVPNAAFAAGASDVTIVVRGASGTNGAVLTVTLSSGGLTEAQTASAVWGADPSGYIAETDFGGVVNATRSLVGTIDTEIGDVASNVWDELRTNHTTAGTFGQYVNAELVTPVTSAALVRMGPFEVRADGLGASDPLDIQKGAQHGIDIQCVDNNNAGIDITSATVTAKVYNSGATLVDTYSCTATYAADGRATFTIDTTVTNTPGTYTATITRTTGASDTQIFGPLRIYVRDI
jgi:hypothetical protein